MAVGQKIKHKIKIQLIKIKKLCKENNLLDILALLQVKDNSQIG